MTEEISFDRIRNILGKYNVPEKRRAGERSLSGVPVGLLLKEVLERDLREMGPKERSASLRMAECIAQRLRSRARKAFAGAVAVFAAGLCAAAGMFIKSNKLI